MVRFLRRSPALWRAAFIALTVLFCVSAARAGAETLYVGPHGNDANAGTAAEPFATIQHAADLVRPGDEVVVQDGTYVDRIPHGCQSPCYVALFSRGGTPDHWVTFRAEHLHKAIIGGPNAAHLGCIGFNNAVAYVKIEGFDISGCYGGLGIGYPTNHDITIAHNHVHNIGNYVTCSTGGIAGIGWVSGVHNLIIDGNIVHDVGRLPSNCTPSTLSYTNDHLMYGHGYDITIVNNVLYNAKAGWEIQVTGGVPPNGTGWVIEHNTFGQANNPYAQGQVIIWTDAGQLPSGVFENNIVYHARSAFLNTFYAPGSQWVVQHNLIESGSVYVGGKPAITDRDNVMGVDPQFEDADAHDYRLRKSSPATRAAKPSERARVTIEGKKRKDGSASLGAY